MTISRLTRALLYVYIAVFVVSGAGSVLFAGPEMHIFFGLEPGALEGRAGASLLNQYRFLRAVELGFGLMLWVLRDRLFVDRAIRNVFLIAFFAIPVARAVSIALDGMPRWPFLALMVIELLLFALFAAHAASAARRPDAVDARGA